MMKPLNLAGILLFLTGVVGATASRAPQPVESLVGKIFWRLEGEWSSSPPPYDEHSPQIRSAPATMFRLSPNSEFSMLQGFVVESQGRLSISAGDPHRVFIGTWTPGGRGADVTYRLVYELVQPVGGGSYPGPEKRGVVLAVASQGVFDGKHYDQLRIDPSNYEEFIAPQRRK